MITSNIFIYLRLQIIHFFSLFLKRGFIEIFRIKENDFIKFTAIIYVKFQISKCRQNLHRYFYKNEKKNCITFRYFKKLYFTIDKKRSLTFQLISKSVYE